MATQAQIDANRQNAQKSTGPTTEAGRARSARNRFSHGFRSSVVFLLDEEREEFNGLVADLHGEYQPATPSEQILLEKMIHHQWNSLRAVRLQSMSLQVSISKHDCLPTDFALLLRYHQSSDRYFFKARTELLTAQKERKKSEIGSERQEPVEPPQLPPEEPKAEPKKAPATAPIPEGSEVFNSIDEALDHLDCPEYEAKLRKWSEEARKKQKLA
jgi:hypothetical protein